MPSQPPAHRSGRAGGWPKGWTPRRQAAWSAKGGTRHLAVDFHDHGWAADYVAKQVASLTSVEGIAAPAGGHRLHEMLGDTLLALLEEYGPTLRPDALITWSRRWPSGRRELWQFLRGPSGLELTHHTRSDPPDGWAIDTAPLPTSEEDSWLRELTDLLTISGYTITHIVTGPDGPQPSTILTLMTGEGTVDPSDWDHDIAADWMSEDEDIAASSEGLTWVPIWARLNGHRITGVTQGAGNSSSVGVVAIDLSEPALLPLRTLAESSWFSEGGGGTHQLGRGEPSRSDRPQPRN